MTVKCSLSVATSHIVARRNHRYDEAALLSRRFRPACSPPPITGKWSIALRPAFAPHDSDSSTARLNGPTLKAISALICLHPRKLIAKAEMDPGAEGECLFRLPVNRAVRDGCLPRSMLRPAT